MKQNTQTISWFFTGVAVAGLLYLGYAAITTRNALATELEHVTEEALAVAEVLDRGGATPMAEKLVRDCTRSERQAFDSMLSDLATLSASELEELNTLFYACGDYYANMRSMVTYQLTSMVERMAMLTQVPTQFSDDHQTHLSQWEQLVLLEQERADLAKQLVTIQKAIIDDLRAGVTADSEAIVLQLNTANEVRQSLALLGNDIDVLRTSIADGVASS